MRTLDRYVFGSFLTSFLLAFLVLTFVMTIALMVQIVGYILDGVAPSLVGEFALVSFPETLQWTVPLALLVAGVLVFSRLSADSEIAAMRACGVNLLSVMKWPALFALLCTVLAAWVNNEIVPRGHEVRRNLKSRVSVETGIDLLEPGRWIDDFPKVKIYFSRKEGGWLHDLHVIDYTMTNGLERTIRASKALVTGEGRDVSFNLYDMTVDPISEDHPGMARAGYYTYTVKDALKESRYRKKAKDLRFRELVSAIRGEDDAKSRSRMKVELSKRFVFAMASVCFVLAGIPLGIRAQRRESSVGMAISLALAIGYYLVVMLMLSLEKFHSIHPEILIWASVAATLAAAAYLTRRNL